ncbi:hypothetical protein [Alkaliphilus sp. B6464]|uniref:hypothetical protein n=1 Tax=Alkaliphilus sp. B6464 TaxID=2731219 RepID=UPI0020126E51|nr:hypothetical protein [Alkaliphilus sp. B6464]
MIHRLIFIDTVNQQMGEIAKTKMEELKSNRIYIEGEEYSILELQNELISFKEKGYKIDISIISLHDNANICYINLKIANETGDAFYNLIRYINFYKSTFQNIYEELTIDSSQFSY